MLQVFLKQLISWRRLPTTNIIVFFFEFPMPGERIEESITFQYGSHPGLSMYRRLVLAVCLKATPLLADGTINSKMTIYNNVYQMFRFVCKPFIKIRFPFLLWLVKIMLSKSKNSKYICEILFRGVTNC